MNRVSYQKLDSYDPEQSREALYELLAPLGGMEAFVTPGQKVLLKPNLLAGKHPDKAVTTHPVIVKTVIEAVIEAGGIPFVGDSPGIGSPEKVAEKSGILNIVKETGATFLPFTTSTPYSLPSKTFRELELAKEYFSCDLVINLPKLKTHQMMGMTCAVKNLFGAVVGMRKAKIHLQAGRDKVFFATLLLELANYLNPALNIVDAVVSMEGNGPGSGDPIDTGFLLAGRSTIAVDTVATMAAGLKKKDVWTQEIAHILGSELTNIADIDLIGTSIDNLCKHPFKKAPSSGTDFDLPSMLSRLLKDSLHARPIIDHKECKLCNACIDACPPKVMSVQDGKVAIERDSCILCFCCQELCPYHAITAHESLLLKTVKKFIG